MNYYVVLDTNVIIAGLRSSAGASYKLLTLLFNEIKPLYNEEIISEYIKVANYDEHKNLINFDRFNALIDSIKNSGIKLDSTNETKEFLNKWTSNDEKEKLNLDKDDVVFYEITFYTKNNYTSNTKLVTHNLKHYPSNSIVVSPSEMLKIIELDKKREYAYNKELNEMNFNIELDSSDKIRNDYKDIVSKDNIEKNENKNVKGKKVEKENDGR